jgi:SSS family solute:Na+ symporter
VVLALFTYVSGLRAPALIAIVKDALIGITVLVLIIYIPYKLGGFGAIFDKVQQAQAHQKVKPPVSYLSLGRAQYAAYASLALGSALALFLYPHAITGVLAAKGQRVIRRNAVYLIPYSFMLGLIALLGYMAIAAGIKVHSASDVVPALFRTLFPSWFVGFAAAAIAISALVPAAIMSIGAANLFTRNLWRPLVNPNITPAGEASTAKFISLIVKFGALLFIVFLPTQYAIDLQLLGGVWILQIFPAIVFTLYTKRLSSPGLFCGWLTGIVIGTALAASQGLKPVFAVHLGNATYPLYIGLIALAANILVTFVLSAIVPVRSRVSEPTRG